MNACNMMNSGNCILHYWRVKVLHLFICVYLNRNSLTSSGITELVQLLGKTEEGLLFLLVQSANCFRIACISDSISEWSSFGPLVFKTSNQSCNIWWSGTTKQVAIASLICSLQRSTKINGSSASSFSRQEKCELTKITWHAFSLRKIYKVSFHLCRVYFI